MSKQINVGMRVQLMGFAGSKGHILCNRCLLPASTRRACKPARQLTFNLVIQAVTMPSSVGIDLSWREPEPPVSWCKKGVRVPRCNNEHRYLCIAVSHPKSPYKVIPVVDFVCTIRTRKIRHNKHQVSSSYFLCLLQNASICGVLGPDPSPCAFQHQSRRFNQSPPLWLSSCNGRHRYYDSHHLHERWLQRPADTRTAFANPI
jgi:hypothetical protein